MRPAISLSTGVVVDPGWGRTEPPVVVRAGDTLWRVAAAHLPETATDAAVAQAWPGWFAANRDVIGENPDHLVPGQRLWPPR